MTYFFSKNQEALDQRELWQCRERRRTLLPAALAEPMVTVG